VPIPEDKLYDPAYFLGDFLLDRFGRFFPAAKVSPPLAVRGKSVRSRYKGSTQLLILAECGDFGFCLPLRGRAGKALCHALPIHFVSEAGMRSVIWIVRIVAVTAWGTTTTTGSGDRAGAKITQFGDLLPQRRALLFQSVERCWHWASSPSVSGTLGNRIRPPNQLDVHILVAHPAEHVDMHMALTFPIMKYDGYGNRSSRIL
jgi:hypothetical protein